MNFMFYKNKIPKELFYTLLLRKEHAGGKTMKFEI